MQRLSWVLILCAICTVYSWCTRSFGLRVPLRTPGCGVSSLYRRLPLHSSIEAQSGQLIAVSEIKFSDESVLKAIKKRVHRSVEEKRRGETQGNTDEGANAPKGLSTDSKNRRYWSNSQEPGQHAEPKDSVPAVDPTSKHGLAARLLKRQQGQVQQQYEHQNRQYQYQRPRNQEQQTKQTRRSPRTPILRLEYDHLAKSALNAISCTNLVPKDKSADDYLQSWCNVAEKWGFCESVSLPLPYQAPWSTETLTNLRKEALTYKARIIAIGDVHGCIQETLDLLRKVQYRPGDVVVFLGDLVAKGPSSEAVVELAMDLGALSVRGNHDEEVTRQFIRQFSDESQQPGNTGAATDYNPSAAILSSSASMSQHKQLARSLSVQQMEWLSNLPFVIRCDDIGALFVHAGFDPQRRLSAQDEWCMMTIRSLDDRNQPTRKCIEGHAWAERWAGPMTVYFGHDAIRGLQRYPHAMCTDSGCVYGGNLTAVLFPEEMIVSVPAHRAYLNQGKRVISSSSSSSSGAGRPMLLQQPMPIAIPSSVPVQLSPTESPSNMHSPSILATETADVAAASSVAVTADNKQSSDEVDDEDHDADLDEITNAALVKSLGRRIAWPGPNTKKAHS